MDPLVLPPRGMGLAGQTAGVMTYIKFSGGGVRVNLLTSGPKTNCAHCVFTKWG